MLFDRLSVGCAGHHQSRVILSVDSYSYNNLPDAVGDKGHEIQEGDVQG